MLLMQLKPAQSLSKESKTHADFDFGQFSFVLCLLERDLEMEISFSEEDIRMCTWRVSDRFMTLSKVWFQNLAIL